MKILSLKIENILSIESAELAFQDAGLILVEGFDYDTGRANGSGKSTIFNALSFALYDKVPRKITASEILRRGTKNGRVTCVLEIAGEIWTVVRSRPKGVTFSIGDKVQIITQEEWESKLRLNYSQFLMSMYTAQGTDTARPRFLLTPDSEKKSFLIQLLNLEIFNEAKKTANDKINSITLSLTKDEGILESLKSRKQAYTESTISVEEINNSISLIKEEITSIEKQVLILSSVVRPDLSRYLESEDKIRNKLHEIVVARTKRTMFYNKYQDLSSRIAGYQADALCSECGTPQNTAESKQLHEAHQLSIKDQMAALKLTIDECDALMLKENSAKDLLNKLKDKKSRESSAYDSAKDSIADFKGQVSLKKSHVQELTLKIDNNDSLLNKINTVMQGIADAEVKISNSKHDLEFYKIIASIYSPTGAQAYILDSIVDFFNEAVSQYVELLWPTASYVLTSYKESAKGDLTAKFSEILTMGGQEVSVGSLSGGELKALSLCADFAILDVLESQFGLKLNPIILDEPFDALDDVGRELVIELLQKLSVNRQILVVDHNNELRASFTNIIRVEKKADISYII